MPDQDKQSLGSVTSFVESLFTGKTLDWMREHGAVSDQHIATAGTATGLSYSEIAAIAKAVCNIMTNDVCPIVNELPN